MLSADPARAVYVQSPMHGVHTWPKVLVWTPETLRASQSERDTSVPCCLYLSEDSNALDSISRGGWEEEGKEGGSERERASEQASTNSNKSSRKKHVPGTHHPWFVPIQSPQPELQTHAGSSYTEMVGAKGQCPIPQVKRQLWKCSQVLASAAKSSPPANIM